MSEPSDSVREQFGDIDVYLFDQLLRGRIVSGMKVLGAGCGSGRNLIFLMRAGFDVGGVDESEEAIAAVQHLATELAQEVPPRRFRVERVESMSHDTDSMDGVISSATLADRVGHRHTAWPLSNDLVTMAVRPVRVPPVANDRGQRWAPADNRTAQCALH